MSFIYDFTLYELQRQKTYLRTCTPNEHSKQPADPHSLIRIFVVRMNELCILDIQNAPSEHSDQTVRRYAFCRCGSYIKSVIILTRNTTIICSLWYLWKRSSAHVYARGHKQSCKLHHCLWSVSIKPRPFFCLSCVHCFQRQSLRRIENYEPTLQWQNLAELLYLDSCLSQNASVSLAAYLSKIKEMKITTANNTVPANTQRRNNVVTTSWQRRCNVPDVVATLCVCWGTSTIKKSSCSQIWFVQLKNRLAIPERLQKHNLCHLPMITQRRICSIVEILLLFV